MVTVLAGLGEFERELIRARTGEGRARAKADPLAQTAERQQQLATAINQHLAHDGFVLAVAGRISGSPKYQVRRLPKGVPSDAEISATLGAFSPEDISDRWRAALERRSTDPAGAITLSRTLFEDVCKWVLTEAAVAGTMATFLVATWRARQDDESRAVAS